MNSISIKNLNFSYGSHQVLKDINLEVEAGEFIVIIGNNGSGDSDIMMTDTINSFKSKFKGFHKTFKQDDLGLSLSSFFIKLTKKKRKHK